MISAWTIEDLREMLVEHTWENLDNKCIKAILREGFEGFDNMSDSDIKEAWKEVFEND
jgi:hypothetical protein